MGVFWRIPPPPPPPPLPPLFRLWASLTEQADELGASGLIIGFGLALLPLLALRVGLAHSLVRMFSTFASAFFSSSKAKAENEKDEEDDSDDDESVLRIALARLRSLRFSPSELVGSVVSQLGQTAFLITSSFVALVAVTLQALSQRSRTVGKTSRVVQQIEQHASGLLATAKAKMEACSLGAMARQAFRDADISGDGSVDSAEVYAVVLGLYLQIGTLAKVTPPERAHVLKLAAKFDMDGSGLLAEDEFILFVTVLFENVAARVAAQVLLAGLLSPYLASMAVAYAAAKPHFVRAATQMVPQVRSQGSAIDEQNLPPPHNGPSCAVVSVLRATKPLLLPPRPLDGQAVFRTRCR
eukprot:scaffold176144_cov30-Tisochrysis_lutea.AAC.1